MLKKILFSFLAVIIALPSILVSVPAYATDEVCGMDGITYSSSEAAESAGVDVSYEFTCTDPSVEEGLYEAKKEINFAGMLVEVGSTDVPTTLIIRDNSNSSDYVVEVSEDTLLGQRRDQYTKLSDWIPGDQVRVIGNINENTGNVEATILINLSIKISTNKGINGWITNINKENKEITYQWANEELTFKYDDDTRFVSGLKNPASVDDLEINDRIRGRLLVRSGEDDAAKIVIVLRRGENLFMKIRTFRPNATITRIDSTVVPTTIQIKIEKTEGLKEGDVNNLIGAEGTLVTVNITEDTVITRKYFGRTNLDEFTVGDKVRVIGRVNDDDTIDAKVLKNNSIWKTSTQGHAGVVTEVNSGEDYLMVDWTPIKHLTKKQLKEKIEKKDNQVIAQSLKANNDSRVKTLVNNIKNRINNTKEKIGNLTRTIKYKKVQINRIKHENVKLGDIVKRMPVKSIKVVVDSKTRIIVGVNENATLNDIQEGDKVRIRGTKYMNLDSVIADTIVVVNSLPEIEENLNMPIDDINEIVSQIDTDEDDSEIVDDTTSSTEEDIDLDENLENEEDQTLSGDSENDDNEADSNESENSDEDGEEGGNEETVE